MYACSIRSDVVFCVNRGLGATEHTRGRPAVILCNAPMGNESPIHRQCDQLHPERENEVWQVKQELELVGAVRGGIQVHREIS